MGAMRWGRARGTSHTRSTVQAQRAARPFLFRDDAPAVFLIIGLLLLTGILLAAAPAAQAKPAGGTWSGLGDSGYWSDNLNWNGSTLPANGVDLVFPAAAPTGNDAMTSTVLTQVGNVAFQRSGYKLYYSSTSPQLSLASGASISGNFNTGTVSWGPRVTLAGNASFGAAVGGTLAFGGAAVSGGGDVVLGTYRLFIAGYGTVALNGVLSGRGQALPGMALYVGRSNGTTALLNGQSTYSGKTVISLGTAKLGIADAIKRCSGVVDDPDGASYLELEGATLDLNGFALAVNELESAYTTAAIANTSATAATLTIGSDDLVNHAACSYAGILSGGGVVDITKDKANSLTFAGNASAGTGGHLEVSGGSVAVGSGTTLAFTDGATVDAGGSLVVDGTLSSSATVAGTLGGGGTLDKWIVLSPGGTLCPSSPDFIPTTLHAGTGASGGQCDAGSTLRFAVADATGAAGTGYDQWAPSAVSLMGSTATPVKVELTSVHGAAPGPCDNWDNTTSHRWAVVSTSGAISGFATDKVSLDTTAFAAQNDVGGGTFAVEQTASGNSVIDVVFTPASSPDTHTWTAGAGYSDQNWSNPLNWQDDSLPGNGDDLVFPAWQSGAVNDDFLTSVGSVDLGEGAYVGGSSLTTAGPMTVHMNDDFSPTWDVPTTLTGDMTVTLTPIGNPTGGPFTIAQDIALQDGTGTGHRLTVDAGDASRAVDYGQLTGSDSDCSLVKQGTGTLKLGGDGGGWTGSNTWAGPTDVQAGVLSIAAPGALSSHTDVHVESGACVKAEMWGGTAPKDVWSNEFTGDGGIEITYGDVTFTGASPSFTGILTDYGAATIASGAVLGGTADVSSLSASYGLGTLYGLGTVQDLTVDTGGTLSPGLGDFGVGRLTASHDASWNGGGRYAVDVSDAGGAAGSGYDSLVIGGDRPGLTVASSAASPFTIFLVSSDGSTAAKCEQFDKTKSCRWHVATLSSGGISGWSAAKDVQVDSTQFATYNDLGGGAFSAEPSTDGTTVDVVFTPSAPDTHTWTGGGTTDKWSEAANWDKGVPSSGDSLVFTGSSRTTPVDDIAGLSLKDVSFDATGFSVTGQAVTVTGGVHTRASGAGMTATWGLDTTLGADATFSNNSSELIVTGDIELGSGEAAHTLTLDGPGTLDLRGSISGGAAGTTSVHKIGTGALWLRGSGMWIGAFAADAGAVFVKDSGAVPSSQFVPLMLGKDVYFFLAAEATDPATWANPIAGDGRVYVLSPLTLTGDSAAFDGPVEVDADLTVTGSLGGRFTLYDDLRGTGTLGVPTLQSMGACSLQPGLADYSVGTLSAEALVASTGGSVTLDVVDAAGEPGTGYDRLLVSGDEGVSFTSTKASPLRLWLRSANGAASAAATGFDATRSYRWPIVVSATGAMTGFAADSVQVVTTQFTNDLKGGAFSVEETTHGDGSASLDVVFTPAASSTHVWSGAGMDDLWSTGPNWVGGTPPSSGDSVTFSGTTRRDNLNDVAGLNLEDVTFTSGGWTIYGNAVSLSGDVTSAAGAGSLNVWGLDTKLGTDHRFTATSGDLAFSGVLSGGMGTALTPTITVAGAGSVGLTGTNTFIGEKVVDGGELAFASDGAQPSWYPITAKDGGTVTYDNDPAHTVRWNATVNGGDTEKLHVVHGVLELGDTDPDGWTGTTTVGAGASLIVDRRHQGTWTGGGTVGGGSTIGDVTGSLSFWPGLWEPESSQYRVHELKTGDVSLQSGAAFHVTMLDATPASSLYDRLAVDGDLTISATKAEPFTIDPFTISGMLPGTCANFDSGDSYSWPIVTVSGSLNGFSPDKFSVDTSHFKNELGGGSFSVEVSADQRELDLVFTPCADFKTGPAVGDGGSAFAKGSKQAVAWEMDAAPPSGSVFKVVADDPGSATDVLLGTVAATSETSYSYDWTIAQGPSTGWHTTVQLWSGSGESAVQYRTKDSQSFDILKASYTIAVSAGDNGTVAPDTEQTVDAGATPTFTFAPDANYHVKQVLVDDKAVEMTGTNEYTFPAVSNDHTISVEFAVDTYDITPSVVGGAEGHGSMKPDTKQTVDAGARPVFTFKPNPNYHVKEVKVDGEVVRVIEKNEYRFPAVAKDHTISVEFAIDTCQITVTPGDNGKIEPGSGPVDYGSSPTYTVTADAGYHIAEVTADDVSQGVVSSVTFTRVAKAHTLSATFAVDTFDITPSVVGGASGHGAISPATTQTVDWHTTPAFTFAPDEGYRVKEVRVDGNVVGVTAPDTYTFPAVTAGHTITVEFVLNAVTITVTPGEHGSITPGTGPVTYGSSPTYAITPDGGYDIADVVVDGTSQGPLASYQFVSATEAHTISAAFTAQPGGGPTTTVTGAEAGWVDHAVTMTFAGHPGTSGSPVAFTEYSVGGGAWVQGSSCRISAEGTTVIRYRSQDEAGVVEDPARQATVRIDTRKPTVVAKALKTQRGTIAGLKYRVKDPLPSSGSALVRAVVRDPAGRIVTRSSSVPVAVNTWLRLRISTKAIHRAGVYTVQLLAKDRAGNWQAGWTTVRMTVR